MRNLIRNFLILFILASLIIPFAAASPSGPAVHIIPTNASIEHPVTYQTSSNASKIVIFDESKETYRGHNKLSQFIDFLNNTLNRTVIINTAPISMSLVASADIIIIPNPGAAYSSEEVEALHRFVENGGALLVMGDRGNYMHPEYLNPIVEAYGISFLQLTIYDDTDNSYRNYNPIVHVFTNDTVAQSLAQNVTDVYYYGGTSLNVSAPAVVVATGDNDTYAKDVNNVVVEHPHDYEIVYMAYYIENNEYQGRVFAIGSSARLRDSYGYFSHNKPFVENLFSRLAQAHKNRVPALVMTVSLSSDVVAYLDEINLTVSLESVGGEAVTNVSLKIELPSGLQIVSGNDSYAIGDMPVGSTFEVSLTIKAVYTIEGDIVVNATGGNIQPLVQNAHVKVISAIEVSAAAMPTAINLNLRNDFVLGVNITNISQHVIHGISVDVILPEGLSGETEATIEALNPGELAMLTFNVTVSHEGIYKIKVSISSDEANPGPYIVNVSFIATTTSNLIVLDLAHTNRPYINDVTQFIGLLKNYGTVIINNGTITPDLLAATKLYILAYPKYGLTSSEINALIRYVESGGSLILTGNAARYSSADGQAAINSIAERFGVYFMDVTVMDETNNSYRPYTPIIHVFNTEDPIGAYLFNGVELIYYQSGTALSISSPDVVPLAFGDDDTYLVDKNNTVLENVTGTNIVTMAYRHREGKIFFIGSTGRFRDKYDYFSTNSPFISNLVSRLLATPQISLSAKLSATSVSEGDTVELKITVSNTGLDKARLQIGIVVSDGLQILNASTVENVTINAPYVVELEVEGHSNVTITILIKAVSAGDQEISIYYALYGEQPQLFDTLSLSVSAPGAGEEEGGVSKALIAGIIIVIIAIVAVLYYFFVMKKKA